MNALRSVGFYTAAGALAGAALTMAKSVTVTVAEQQKGACIGLAAGFAHGVARTVKLSPKADVAAQVAISAIALAVFHSENLFNAPTTALFSIISTVNVIGAHI